MLVGSPDAKKEKCQEGKIKGERKCQFVFKSLDENADKRAMAPVVLSNFPEMQ